MSIILDTSIWIEYFKGNDNYFDICQQLIEKGEVATIELIFAELLQGARSKREVILAGEYSQKGKLISKGIGLIDACIITATITSNSKLWTLDKKIIAFLKSEYLF